MSASDEEIKVILPAEPYRGIKPFRYADRNIFSGREWESDRLLNLILLYRGSLLYGESGIGKSSVVNAGLIPLMEENNLQPEIIRIYPNRKQPFRIYKIENSDNDKTYFPSLFDGFSTGNDQPIIFVSLDNFKKQLLLQTYGETEEERVNVKNKPTPVLLFDQFEEIITLFEETGKVSIADGDIPINERIEFQVQLFNFFYDFYYNDQLRVKFLFSFREDYLAKMSKLLRAIPDLRDHSLRIKAIDKTDIYDIIQCPFKYKKSETRYDAAFKDIIPVLNDKLVRHFEDRNTVLTDVQIVCQYLYDSPEARADLLSDDAGKNEKNIDKYIQLFYAELLTKLPPSDKPLAVAILSLLVLNEHTRNIFHTDAIIAELKNQYPVDAINTVLIKLDEDTRLIKSELRPGSLKAYYEINSESLIPYINKLKVEKEQEAIQAEQELKTQKEQEAIRAEQEQIRKKEQEEIEARYEWEKSQQEIIRAEQERKRKEQERADAATRKNRFIIIAAISLVVALTVFYLFSMRQEKNNNLQSKYVYAAGANEYVNPTLSYIIAKKGGLIGNSNAKLDSIINNFSYSKNYYVTNIFSYPHNIVTAFFDGGRIGVVQQNAIDYLDRNGLVISRQSIPGIIYADPKRGYLITVKTIQTLKAKSIDPKISSFFPKEWIADNINIRIYDDEIRKFDGSVIGEFVYWHTPRTIAISPDRKILTVDGYIYNVGETVPHAQINRDPEFKDLMAVKFTNDSKHILAGFWSGHVTVNDLGGKWIKIFEAGSFNSVVTCLAACINSKYLVVGGRENNLRFFELGDINLPGKDKLTGNEIITKSKTIYLEKENATGQINDVVLSPTDKEFLSVADDKTGSVWNFDGKKVGLLYGHKESIVSGAFAKNGKQILTWTSSGKIYIWEGGDINKAYDNKRLATFSPFDYRISNLDNFNVKEIYPDITVANKGLAAALNYLASLPDYNFHPEDKEYQKTSKNSLAELSKLFLGLQKPAIAKKLNVLNRKLLYYSYSKFRQDSLNLIAGTAHEDSILNIRYLDKLRWASKALTVDTADTVLAIDVSRNYGELANIFADSAMNYKYSYAIEASKYGVALLEAFHKKYPENKMITDQLASSYGNNSWYALFTKDYQTALASAQKGLSFGGQFDWINTNLALGYLLSGKFYDAEKIYNEFKNKNKSNGSGPFKYAFLGDFAALTKAGVINMKDARLAKEIYLIKVILNSE